MLGALATRLGFLFSSTVLVLGVCMFTGSVKFQKQAQGFSISKQHFFTRIHPIPSWLLYSCLHARDSGYTLPQDASFPSLSIPISDWIFGVAQINSSLLTISVTAILLPGMCCPLFWWGCASYWDFPSLLVRGDYHTQLASISRVWATKAISLAGRWSASLNLNPFCKCPMG